MALAADLAEGGTTTVATTASQPRLAPIAWSWNPLVWIALAAYRSIGDTTPVRVIFARAPRVILAHMLLMITSEYGLSLERRLRALVRVHGSRVNGCSFCDNLETRVSLAHEAIAREDADALAEYASSPRFGERERAALRYVEELNTNRQASTETFDALRAHFTEREIVELTWLNGVGNYLNLQARPLGLSSETCAIPRRAAGASTTTAR